MKTFLTAILILTFGTAISPAQTKCFENIGLKSTHKIEFTITGGKISGWYSETGDDESNYEFGGTRAGNALNIKFTESKTPALMPKGKNWVWTLAASGNTEILRMNVYGQNYETRKFSIYPVDFDSCAKRLSNGAKRVSFAKGASSAKVAVAATPKQAFLINVRKGQFIGAVAFGYSVSIYYPNGDVYAFAEEGRTIKDQTTNLDFSGSDAAPASGDTLVVLEKAPEGTGKAVFIVKNTARELEKAIENIVNSRGN